MGNTKSLITSVDLDFCNQPRVVGRTHIGIDGGHASQSDDGDGCSAKLSSGISLKLGIGSFGTVLYLSVGSIGLVSDASADLP